MVPVVNVIAAIYSAFVLHELSETRESIKGLKQKNLFENHHLALFEDENKNKLMFNILTLLDENKSPCK